MILDFIEKIEIYSGITLLANFHSILQLKEGIFMVYNNINQIQNNYWELRYPDASPEQLEIYNKTKLSFSGESNQVDAQTVNLFHWYSINLINYAKCCGLIKFLNEKMILPEYIALDKKLIAELRETQSNYINNITELIPVVHFRNKASAHLAFTDPKNYDNPATLIESMSIIPTYLEGKMTMGALKRKKGLHVSSFSEHQWNITDNFDSLIPRYFKEKIG
ncbi:hypothetical protein G3567_04650 [Psychroflexus sp. YR1-1]|uniref:Uncharacterized protein n=1 Tax=Psychroflexus aurantiacus TaxID=2709310 RepID=A0A6B3QZ37_9FLAO|nr:hypothetical protein [Psychroflexus aurantiacus]NEV93439.1 hypothetical protein [Psychroflexus aurantiacus]